MKTLSILSIFTILLFSLLALNQTVASVNAQDILSPTPSPTYDPLAEPVLPENPSELELGHFWYWHNCMTCHGDIGQGLTDEFRGIWPEDHQNCWAHGCHSGNMDGGGFPIPRDVPPLVNQDKLSQFSSQESLVAYLNSTHPPQDPGVLEDEQYLAIVRYLYFMNKRPLEEATPVPTQPPSPTVTLPPIPDVIPESNTPRSPAGVISIGIILFIVLIWGLRIRRSRE